MELSVEEALHLHQTKVAEVPRTDEQKAQDYTSMGNSVTVITNLIAGDADVIGDMTVAYRKEKVKRNYQAVENMKAYDDWGSEDMTAATNAIAAGKTFVG
tara:strand:- start:197 stop:496 length:300 start_codon:yes stop_codon:yes gene_type:complete